MINKSLFVVLLASLLGLSASVAAWISDPDRRDDLRRKWMTSDRQVLAKIEADLTGRGDRFVVIKVLTSDSLSLEYYRVNSATGSPEYLARSVLPEKRDGQFNYQGNATNLALADLNFDQNLEILAPAFDDNLVPRLHVFEYDSATDSFAPYREDK